MAYITRANFRRISYQLNEQQIIKLDDTNNVILCEDIPSLKFDYLNKMEKQMLLAFKEFVLHPEIIFKPEYNKLNTHDTKKYIFESVAAYHFDPDCEKLNQDFNGLLLPDTIKEQGDDKIIEFRHWYRENMHLLEEEKKDIFEMHLLTRFGIHRNEIEIVDKKNSGTRELENYSTEDICAQIKELSLKFKSWLCDNPNKEEHKLRFYSFIQIAYKGRCTYLGDDYEMEKHLAEIHERNKSKFTDQEILDCLREAHTEYKLPMIELLKKYYMIKYNADTKVDVNILEALGFKPCSACCAISNSSIES